VSTEVQTCSEHGVYAIDRCPGCSLREKSPSVAKLYEGYLAELRRRELRETLFDQTPELWQISSRLVWKKETN
jgi:hypothetical protein